MKYFLPLFVATAVCSAGVIEDPTAGYVEGNRFFYFPGDGDGKLHLVDSNEPADVQFIAEWARNPNNNAYWLYTRYDDQHFIFPDFAKTVQRIVRVENGYLIVANPRTAQILIHEDPFSVYKSYFDNNKDTVFLAHGWNGNGNNEMNMLLTAAFLEDEDVNVIVLDWSRLANRNYVTAKSGTAAVGRGLGEFIIWLTTLGIRYERVHLVGFSLGGHLVGNAGRVTSGRVARITALDPAGPLWLWDSDRVSNSDGQYVEVIHTNTGLLGYSDVCGDADFYPNGGSTMPGCWLNSCSHGRAYEYMASSVRYNHLHANECDTLRQASRDRCTGDLNPMGNSDLTKSRAGIFRVNTARNYPY